MSRIGKQPITIPAGVTTVQFRVPSTDDMIDELAEEYLDWAEILEGYGWTYFREGGDGSEEWTRPGGVGKSATVNWPESPESPMSLFSDDPSTGLADLKEAEIHLTKWRVFLRLVHGDDVWAALDDLGLRGSKVE